MAALVVLHALVALAVQDVLAAVILTAAVISSQINLIRKRLYYGYL